MFKSLRIQNFQSHKDTLINFSSLVNVFIGESSTGKSSIIRALRWVMENKPSGDGFIRKGSKKTVVTLTLDTGDVIKRVRLKKDNTYYLNDIVFKAFGVNVPDEIQKILNMGVENFQLQKDSFFLLNKSAGEVGRHFNDVASLEKIDFAIKNMKTLIRKNSTDCKLIKKTMENEIDKLENLKMVNKDNEIKVQNMLKFQIKLKKMQDELKSKIDFLHDKFIPIQNNVSKCSYDEKIKILMDKGFILYHGKYNDIINKLNVLNTLYKAYTGHYKAVNDTKPVHSIKDRFKACKGLKDKLQNINEYINNRKALLINYSKNKKTYQRLEKELNIHKEEFNSIFPDNCPLCGKEKS